MHRAALDAGTGHEHGGHHPHALLQIRSSLACARVFSAANRFHESEEVALEVVRISIWLRLLLHAISDNGVLSIRHLSVLLQKSLVKCSQESAQSVFGAFSVLEPLRSLEDVPVRLLCDQSLESNVFLGVDYFFALLIASDVLV